MGNEGYFTQTRNKVHIFLVTMLFFLSIHRAIYPHKPSHGFPKYNRRDPSHEEVCGPYVITLSS